jgi:3' terminal RNA ribose 2'-O-methyltransferase Hen1
MRNIGEHPATKHRALRQVTGSRLVWLPGGDGPMLLTITTTNRPATDLGYLLHKHPERFQSYDLSFGKAHVFYPEASTERCRVCLLLDVDPVGMVRGKGRAEGLLDQYVNDRPYVASSFLSVAISQVFGSALQGRCNDRPELVANSFPLEARLDVLPVRGGERFLRAVFEPLGYSVEALRHPLDERFPAWGESPYFSVTVSRVTTLSDLLTHLYVLVPVFDNAKHYYVGEAELEKLLAKGSKWLANHPEREEITRRYLKFQPNLFRQALARLVQEEQPSESQPDEEQPTEPAEEVLEKPLSLNEQRLGAVLAALRASAAKRVLDLGCGEGRLLRELLKDKQFEEIVGMDVSIRTLETVRDRLKLDRLPERQAARIKLMHGSLIYRDRRLEGFDSAAVVEVVEHLDRPRLLAFERAVFEFARPGTVVLTTPNREYNVTWENVGVGRLRHPDHRFEWTRQEFRDWAEGIVRKHGYSVRFLPVGTVDETLGSPTQMAVFERADGGRR